jgi:hypothetical protein
MTEPKDPKAPEVTEEEEVPPTETRKPELRTDGTGVIPGVPPLPQLPPKGTANVRVRLGFPVHEFTIPSHELHLNQTEWTNVPLDQVSEISQIAAESQVLLDVVESADSATK